MSRDTSEVDHEARRIGPGALVLVVGPSGAGKDALIAGAREELDGDPRFSFPERVVTRPAHAAEDHATLSDAAFVEMAQRGGFALTWQAHGLRYGVPASIDEAISKGCTAVVNVSRTICGEAHRRYERAYVLLIDCPVEVRAARLASRGREEAGAVQARIDRSVTEFDPASVDARIDNAGTLEDGVRQLVAALRSIQQG